jgi:hypothetical protein
MRRATERSSPKLLRDGVVVRGALEVAALGQKPVGVDQFEWVRRGRQDFIVQAIAVER